MKEEENYEALAESIRKRLSLDQQISLLSGKCMWTLNGVDEEEEQQHDDDKKRCNNLDSIWLSDGPHGLRKTIDEKEILQAHPATCFPTACTLACSWNLELMREIGMALSQECQQEHVAILLGPGMNLKRHPCGGRNFEYFSEDPILSGTLAKAMVQGIQYDNNNKVGACIKHFCVNNQETLRFRINAIVDERTLRELYLRGFELAIKAAANEQQPWTVMCAYNSLNGTYCSEHSWLLQDVLRKEWGFQGWVMTDWGATNHRVKSIQAGMDLEMPGSYGAHHEDIKLALETKMLSQKTFHKAVERNLCLILQANAAKKKQEAKQSSLSQQEEKSNKQETSNEDNTKSNQEQQQQQEKIAMMERHHELAYRAALDSIVLLQNKDDIVPLKATANSSMALIGDFCKYPRYQGMGSSKVTSYKVDTIYEEMTKRYNGTNIQFARGYDHNFNNYNPPSLIPDDDTKEEEEAKQQPLLTEKETHLIEEAVALAKNKDVVVIVAGLPGIYESEAYDRTNLDMPHNQNELIRQICQVNSNTIVLLNNGGPVSMPWNNSGDTPKAIFEGYLMGQAGARAFVDILLGDYSPCGKLAETFPLALEDVPSNQNFPGDSYNVEYREGLHVGYRYFDSVNFLPVLFPFGHGLSYTTFSYTDLSVEVLTTTTVSKERVNNQSPDQSSSTLVTRIQFQLANTGSMPASEVVQCYVHYHSSIDDDNDGSTTTTTTAPLVYHPEQELKHFQKVHLQPNESKTIKFDLVVAETFAFYDVGLSDWVVEQGQYEIRIGGSSRDIRVKEFVHISSSSGITKTPSTLARETYPPLPVKEEEKETTTTASAFAAIGLFDDELFERRMGGKEQLEKSQSPFNPSVKPPSEATTTGETTTTTSTEVVFHRNSLLKETRSTRLGRLLTYLIMKGAEAKTAGDTSSSLPNESNNNDDDNAGDDDNNVDGDNNDNVKEQKMIQSLLLNLPLRCLVLFSEGNLTFEGLDTIIDLLNGEYWKATWFVVTALGTKLLNSLSFFNPVR